MYNSIDQIKTALRRSYYTGVVIYQGPSRIDGAPIVAIANRIGVASTNEKTGAMVQTFILRSDIAPHHAIKTGADKSVCGNCPSRPILKNATRCYVKVFQAPRSVYEAFKRGRYMVPGIDFDKKLLPELFRGLDVRFGSYGDPYAVPVRFWLPLAKHAASYTGYSHQWRRASRTLARLCMASADSAADTLEAVKLGWRAFRVKKANEPKLDIEFGCPAARENGQRVTCADCGLCAGNSIAAKNAVINDHGLTRNRLAA